MGLWFEPLGLEGLAKRWGVLRVSPDGGSMLWNENEKKHVLGNYFFNVTPSALDSFVSVACTGTARPLS